MVFGSLEPAVFPKCAPVIWSNAPCSASAGATAWIVGRCTEKLPTAILFLPLMTSTGPLVARSGTLTSRRSGSHRWIRAGDPLNRTRLSWVVLNCPNPFPEIVTVAPGGAASGNTPGSAQTGENQPAAGNPRQTRMAHHIVESPECLTMGSRPGRRI